MFFKIVVHLVLLNLVFGLECPSIKSTFAMPSLDPVQYSYQVEITLPDEGLTLDAFEFNDHERDTASLYVGKAYGSNNLSEFQQVTYDYQYNQTFVVDSINGSKTCTVHDLNPTLLPHQPSLFGVGIENGPLAVNYSFYWNGTYNASYMGVKVIDGIKTNHYNTCLSFLGGNLTYMVDVYFSFPNWTLPTGQEAPVLLKLNATDISNQNWLYYFKFSGYHNSRVPRLWTPQKPHGIVCPGRKDGPVFPTNTSLSQIFSVSQLRWSYPGHNVIYDVIAGYDFDSNILKDVVNELGSSTADSNLYDFNQGLLYTIAMPSMKCSVSSIPLRTSLVTVVNGSLVKMRDIRKDSAQSNLTYGGITLFKGVQCHSWIAQTPIKTFDDIHNVSDALIYVDFYMTVKKWNGRMQLVGTKTTTISMVNSTNLTTVMYDDLLSVSNHIPSNFFDIRACFNESTSETFILKFAASYSADVQNYFMAFKNSLISTVAKMSNVSKTRVVFNKYGVYSSASKDKTPTQTNLFVWITILGVPAVKGNPAIMVPEANLTMALSKLRSMLSSNQLQVTFNAAKLVTMTAFSDYQKTQDDLLFPESSPSPAPLEGFSKGAVAGIAVGLLVGGFILGLLVYHCRSRRSRSQYAYAMQD